MPLPVGTKRAVTLAVLLTANAGWADAVGYLRLNRLFVSFMSGNTTQLGVALAEGHGADALRILGIIALFVGGSALGAALVPLTGQLHLRIVLAIEAALLLAALPGDMPETLRLSTLVLAMGIQNAALHRVGAENVGLTYVTGTLVKLGRGLGNLLIGKGGGTDTAIQTILWLGMGVGALGGAAVEGVWGWQALAVPAVATVLLALFAPRPRPA